MVRLVVYICIVVADANVVFLFWEGGDHFFALGRRDSPDEYSEMLLEL